MSEFRSFAERGCKITPDAMLLQMLHWMQCGDDRRVECIEPDGPRRTWLLFSEGRQTGHIRGRNPAAAWWEDAANQLEWLRGPTLMIEESRGIARACERQEGNWDNAEWFWEAAGAGRDILGGDGRDNRDDVPHTADRA